MKNQRNEAATKQDVEQVKQDVEQVKQDVEQVKQDVEQVKQDVEQVKQDVKQVKQDVKRVRQDLGAKLDANAAKIDANAAKIDANAAKIDANTEKLDRVIRQVVENSVRLDQMVTRDEFNSRMDELIAGQDKMISLFANLNQERIATNARLDRVETDVENNKNDIEKIKTKLAMP